MTEGLEGDAAEAIASHMSGFLRSGATGCAFARAHARQATEAIVYQVVVGDLSDALPDDVSTFLDAAAKERAAAMVVFPELRSPDAMTSSSSTTKAW